MSKKLLIIIMGIVLAGIVCICLLTKNKPAEQIVIDCLNESVSHYADINVKDNKAYSLRVSDVQMLVTTYVPEYTIFGVSTSGYKARPTEIDEALTTENKQELPICDFEYILLYDEKSDRFYSVKFEVKSGSAIPDFVEATELKEDMNRTAYVLQLPHAGSIDSISLKKNADSFISISNRSDIETILDALENTKPTTVSGEIGTPVRVENIINVDFNKSGNVVGRLFLYENNGKYFIEQTGNGVYIISEEVYEVIADYC